MEAVEESLTGKMPSMGTGGKNSPFFYNAHPLSFEDQILLTLICRFLKSFCVGIFCLSLVEGTFFLWTLSGSRACRWTYIQHSVHFGDGEPLSHSKAEPWAHANACISESNCAIKAFLSSMTWLGWMCSPTKMGCWLCWGAGSQGCRNQGELGGRHFPSLLSPASRAALVMKQSINNPLSVTL